MDWCEDGNLPEPDDRLAGAAAWSNIVIQGNLQIHNSPRDGD
jgi:hypothetical protein